MIELPKTRSSNIVDIFRMIGCFAIVWCHSGYYWHLTAQMQDEIGVFKGLLVTFAMPFFYIMTSFFAVESLMRKYDFKSAWVRLRKFWIIIIIYTLVYEVPKIIWAFIDRGYPYKPFNIDTSNGLHALWSIMNTLTSVNNSPMYYIFNIFVIYCLAILSVILYRHRKTKTILFPASILIAVLVWWTIVGGAQRLLSKDIVLLYLFSLAYYFITKRMQLKKYSFNALQTFILLTFTVLSIGFLSSKVSPYLLSPIFLLIKDIVTLDDKSLFLRKLSSWGQHYSFGIFAWHYFFLIILGYILPKLWLSIGFTSPSVALYALINIAGFTSALLLGTILIRIKRLRQIFLLH